MSDYSSIYDKLKENYKANKVSYLNEDLFKQSEEFTKELEKYDPSKEEKTYEDSMNCLVRGSLKELLDHVAVLKRARSIRNNNSFVKYSCNESINNEIYEMLLNMKKEELEGLMK